MPGTSTHPASRLPHWQIAFKSGMRIDKELKLLTHWQRFIRCCIHQTSLGRRLLVCLVFLGCLTGCGSDGPALHGVSGIVSLDAVALEQGSITFLPLEGTSGPNAGSEIVKGVYSIPKEKGLVEGKYRVEVRAQKKTGKRIEVGSPTPPGTMMDEVVEAVAPRFNSQSTLEAEIPPTQESLDFNVSSK